MTVNRRPGRPPKFTPDELAQIDELIDVGEPLANIAKRFNCSASFVYQRTRGYDRTQIQNIAADFVRAERVVLSLTPDQQRRAWNLVQHMREISTNLMNAAVSQSATAYRLSAIANAEAQKIDDADPESSVETIKMVSALTKTANESASIPLALINANREAIKESAKDDGRDLSADSAKVEEIRALLAADKAGQLPI